MPNFMQGRHPTNHDMLNYARSWLLRILPYGLVARIAGFHPAGPGSIPGMGNFFSLSKKI